MRRACATESAEGRGLRLAPACLTCLFLFACGGGRDLVRIQKPWIVAHRGASHLAPENTLAAARLAWQLGADALECDVWQSSDGRILVIHDSDTLRTSGRYSRIGKTPWSKLKRLDVGSFLGAEYAGERIPLLSELLETVPAGRHVLVEVKGGPEILTELGRVLDASGKLSQVILMSFRLEVLALARQRWPNRPLIFLKKSEKLFGGGASLPGDGASLPARLPHSEGLFRLVEDNGLDGLGLDSRGLELDFIRKVKARGLLLFVWTVDDPARATRLFQSGVDGVISNRPGHLRRSLEGRPK